MEPTVLRQTLTSPQTGIYIFIAICIIGLIFLIKNAYTENASLATPENVKAIKDQQIFEFEEKLNVESQKDRKSITQAFIGENKLETNEDCLINFQPLTVIQPGYVGPIQNGVFAIQEGVSTAIKIGARCIIFPIDFYSTNISATLNKPNIPCFVYRNEGGTMLSLNSGSIKEAAQTLANVAWSNISFQKNDPLILILYFVNTPEKDTKEYVQFLSRVAKDLKPLEPFFLFQDPAVGNFFRQGSQDKLLFESVNIYEKKCLVFCNIDTSIFRDAKKLQYLKLQPFSTSEDLDYIVNLRLFKQNKDTDLGPTELENPSSRTRGVVEKLSYFTNLPTDQTTKNSAIASTKEKWTIALSPSGSYPEVGTTKKMIDLGVQCIPLPLFGDKDKLFAQLNQWKVSWSVKAKDIRYQKPSNITPTPQSPQVNTNGGTLSPPS